MDYRERGSHTRGEYLTQDTSHMGTARGRSKRQNNSTRVVRNLEERNVGTKEKSSKHSLTSAKNLTIEIPEGRSTNTNNIYYVYI